MLITGTVVLLTVQRLFLGSVGPLVDTHLNGNAALQGFLQLAFTLGGVSGGLLIGRYRMRLPPRTSAHAILGTCAAAFVTLCVVSMIPFVLAACFAIGVTVSFWSVFQSQAQDAGDDRREADVLARIGLGQSVAAITVFAAASALALLAQPRFVMAALGLLLVCLGMAAAHALSDTRRQAEADSTP
jgi:predicted MFS family arabinose efflux permease